MFFNFRHGVLLVSISIATTATAQSIAASPRNDAPVTAVPLRVQVSVQRSFSVSGTPEEQDKIMARARRFIYESATTECAVLSPIFKAECRLVSINANSSIMDRGDMGPTVNANGTATYELLPQIHASAPEK